MTGESSNKLSLKDEDLVRQMQAGDHGAFERLVVKYQDRVYNICYKLVSHSETARDLAQETFLKAFESIQQFEHKSSFYTWLFRIAVNVSISERRRRQKHKVHQADELLDSVGHGQAGQLRALAAESAPASPPQQLQQREMRRAISEALARLEEDHRVILVLRDIESLDYQAIADVLGVPIGTVRSRLHRARLAMKEMLKPVMGKAG